MPRKKKGASKAQEPASNNGLGKEDANKLSINKEFAEQYEASKRKEILANTPAALLEDSESSSSSEEEDEYGELLTRGIDKRVQETLEAIRKKDPRIYDKEARFFENASESADEEEGDNSDDEPVAGWDTIANAAKAEAPKLTLKDYVRETLLTDGRLSEDESDEEQRGEEAEGDVQLENQIVSLEENGKEESAEEENEYEDDDIWGNDGSDDDDFFKKKVKTKEEEEEEQKDFENFLAKHSTKASQRAGEELLLHSYLENEKPDEKERFLRDFVLNNGWLDKNASEAPAAGDYEIEVDNNDIDEKEDEFDEKEDEFDEKVDEFEAKYNFRFEDPDGAQVITHARNVADSLRRPDERRKRARAARKLRKDQEKLVKTEEIKRLKNLKKREVQARLLAIQEAAGDGVDVSGIDLEGDFDPDEFNRQMEKRFGDEYYAKEDKQMEELNEEEVATASEKRVEAAVPEDAKEDVNRLMDEYYNLDYEDIVGGVPMRFNYKQVDAESFSLRPEEILEMEDKELNRMVSLKMLAPYRARRDVQRQAWKAKSAVQKRRKANPMQGPDEGNGYTDETASTKKRKKRKRGNSEAAEGDSREYVNDGGHAETVQDDREDGGEDLTAQQGEETENGEASTSKKKKKRRKKGRESDMNIKHEQAAEDDERKGEPPKNINVDEPNEPPSSKKKRRKKRNKSVSEAAQALSDSRKKAYGIT